jgi:hypothetical protein
MMNYVISDTGSGEILRWGTCEEREFPRDIVGAVEGYGTPQTHYVCAGVLTAYTEQERANKQAAPSPWHVWSNTSMSWSDTRPASQITQAQRDKIILDVEAKEAQQARALRECAIAQVSGNAPPAEAVARLQSIDTAIGLLRAQLHALGEP